jgi:predicted TIM-barrel fold metal-dependent hydrolase
MREYDTVPVTGASRKSRNRQLGRPKRESSVLCGIGWRRAFRAGAAIALLVLCLGLIAVGRAGQAGPAAAPSQPPADEAALSALAVLEPIDSHTHVFQASPAFLEMLRRLHMHILDILVVDDTNPYRSTVQQQKQDAARFVDSSGGIAKLCTTFNPFRVDEPDFVRRAIQGLNRDFAQGANAVKIWKNVGMELKDASGKYVLPGDPRLQPIYRDIAAHRKTLIAHLAEPDTAWNTSNPNAPYAGYYGANPQWNMSQWPDRPRKQAILEARDRVLARNPRLRLVGAHLGSMENDVADIAVRFDRYPNFAIDTAARVLSLAVQPRDKVRNFIVKYQDRIVYGTDLGFYARRTDEEAAREWERRYALDWRYFATGDTFQYQGRETHGLNLPAAVLTKLYHDNAARWIPGIAAVRR